MGRRVHLGRVLGVDVSIDWSCVFTFILAAWTLATIGERVLPTLGGAALTLLSAVAAIGLFASLVVHEIAHGLAARACGAPVRSITIFSFGGITDVERAPASPRSEAISAVVAPFTNAGIGTALFAIVAALGGLAVSKLFVTGAVELNPETTEMATLLVGGRIERVNFGVGDRVQRGAVLAVVSSPLLAQMHGKMHEAKTKYELAQRNLTRVQRSENRVAVLQAKAKLDEAEATLKRTKRLIELGAGAGKDIVTAETTYRTAKAAYDFQSNIALNKELQEARAEVETSQVDLRHIEDEMRALGVPVESGKPDDHRNDSSLVALRSPLSGVITERRFNAGAGIEAATPIFSISNLGTVYVIANVPEANLAKLNVGSVAEITSPSIGTVSGRVSYIDPKLDETTRTGRVRIEVANPNGKLRAGMFAEVGFYTGTNEASGEELVVPSDAVQRTGDKSVVFVPRENEAGAFEVREIEAGADINGYTKVIAGLKLGEKVVTKGSFTLKTQLEKAAMGDE